MKIAFRILEAIFSIYNFLCFVRIILTWIPSLSYSKVTKVLAAICDPYLNLFRKIRWLTIGSFDFSPAIALCLLGAVSSIFSSLAGYGTFSFGTLLALLVQLIWSIASSLLTFFIILLIVRLIVLLLNKNNYNSGSYILEQIDRSISPMLYNICKTFTGKRLTYKTALIVGIVVFIVILVACSILFGYLVRLITYLPF